MTPEDFGPRQTRELKTADWNARQAPISQGPTTEFGARMLDKLLRRLGLCRVDDLNPLPNIEKRLDEHREMLEAIAERTDLLEREPWRRDHLETQDKYLSALFRMVHGIAPEQSVEYGRRVRQKPTIGD